MGFRQIVSQMKPPSPVLTENNCPDQRGKVFLVTGGYSGVGRELAKILYQKKATVYIAGRSAQKADEAIAGIRGDPISNSSSGRLEFLSLDLNDLDTIKAAAESFIAKEQRLDVLWNNAGVMHPPQGSVTKQGYEQQLGSNCLAHFLLAKLLWPLLVQTASLSPKGSVRVCWTGSLYAEISSTKEIINFDDINYEKGGSSNIKYAQSKAANILLGSEFAARHEKDGVYSYSLNPGNLKSGLQRHGSAVEKLVGGLLLYPPVYGAYTELFAGLSPDVLEWNGAYIIPWGRIAQLDSKFQLAVKSKDKDGTGIASQFYDWCSEETASYMT